MAAQTTWAKRSKSGKSMVSCTLAGEGMTASGRPSVETTTWYLVPGLPRSVGFGPVSSPPRLARTEQLSTTTSHVAASGAGARHADEDGMDPAQHRRRVPLVQAAAQGGTRGAPICGLQFPPLDALAQKEAERPDHLQRRHRRAPWTRVPVLDPVDDVGHQLYRLRLHVHSDDKGTRTSRRLPDRARSQTAESSGNRALISMRFWPSPGVGVASAWGANHATVRSPLSALSPIVRPRWRPGRVSGTGNVTW